jgi:hypothetical protein
VPLAELILDLDRRSAGGSGIHDQERKLVN